MTVPDENCAPPRSSWFFSLFVCCSPLTSCLKPRSRRSKSPSLTTIEASWPVSVGATGDQDLLINEKAGAKSRQTVVHTSAVRANPPALPSTTHPLGLNNEKNMAPRQGSGSPHRPDGRLKKIFRSGKVKKRPQISAPSNFRHVETGAFDFPPPDSPPPQPHQGGIYHDPHLRPLQLSIYLPNNRISPLLPHFEFPPVTTPAKALLEERLGDDHELVRQRSYSSVPFHIPRKPVREEHSPGHAFAPEIPLRSQARARAHTSPEIEAIKARVATAMLEVEELERQIEDAVERQSLYALSRPSTGYSTSQSGPGEGSPLRCPPQLAVRFPLLTVSHAELEPMPSIPALPPAAPSFAERLNSGADRPRTAPMNHKLSSQTTSLDQPGSPQVDFGTATRVQQSTALAPPLPLVLRPPLRKKKSFSRVSTWLFPGGAHRRDVSLDSITNAPRPIKGTDGFYQCVQPVGLDRRASFDSLGTLSTWDSDDDQRTAPTNWSPESASVAKMDGVPLERQLTFGKRGCSP